MAGPHPPSPGVGTNGPPPHGEAAPAEAQPVDYPHETGESGFVAPASRDNVGPPYPGTSPAGYPKRRPKRLIIGTLVVIAVVAAITAAIVYGVRTNGARAGGAFTERAAQTAVQGYLDALVHRDIDTLVRNSLCGIYEGVRDKRPDQALARMNSDAFRKQFSEVSVTSIDKIVFLSQYQAQVLFTMQATPATGGPPRGDIQGVAQLLFQRNQVLVCSYVLRTAGTSY